MKHSSDLKVVGGLVCLALAVGGAGIYYPLLELLLQAAAICIAGYFVITRRRWRFNTLSVLALALLGAAALLPILQLIPLPPALWQLLPGRELPKELDGLLGSSHWRPWTLDVEATIRSLLRLFPAAVIFVGCMFLPFGERARLLRIILVFALFGAVLGIIQLVTGGWLTPYLSGHLGYPVGLFVNRNHQAAFLVAAMPICAAIFAVELQHGKPRLPLMTAALSALIVLAITVIGTTSRMGFAMLPLGVAGALIVLLRRQPSWNIVVPALGVLTAMTGFLVVTGKFTRTLSRFSSLDNPRLNYWSDIQWALQHYGLAGTGVGTFIPVFQTAESLDSVTPAITNHAHNDYLELLLAGGLAAAILVLIFLVLLGVAMVSAWRSRRSGERATVSMACAVSIGILLLFSLVDYPLRMPAVGSTLAVLCAVLLPTKPPASRAKVPGSLLEGSGMNARPSRFWLPRLPALVVLALLLIGAVQAGVSARAILNERYDVAVRWAPWSTRSHEGLATAALLESRPAEALNEGLAALQLSPISVPAIRTIGLVQLGTTSPHTGNQLMQIAATLGWRDPITQLWAIDTAEQTGEPQKAIQRAEALFRQQTFVAPALSILLRAPAAERMPMLLAADLARQPSWRGSVFESGGQLSGPDIAQLQETIVALNRTRAPVSLDEVEPFLDGLVEHGEIDDAQRIWALFHNGNLVANGNFESFDISKPSSVPRYWDVDGPDLSRVSVGQPDPNSRNHALRLLASRGGSVLSQELMLQPGVYAFTYRARVGMAPYPTLRWELRCPESGQKQAVETAIPNGADWRAISLTFTVPDRDCRIQRLALRRVQATNAQQVWLDELELSASRR